MTSVRAPQSSGRWVLWSQVVMVLLSVTVNVIVHDPETDGQGGAHIFVIGFVAAAALAVGVGMARIHRREHTTRMHSRRTGNAA